MKIKVGVIGGGNMGAAIIGGIYKQCRVIICEQDKKRAQSLKRRYKVVTADLQTTVQKSRVIILAVKPQNFDGVLESIKEHVTKDHIIVSIAAGITTSFIQKRLGPKVRIIRTMPNLPAQVKEGITGICRGKTASSNDVRLAQRIFGAVGKTVVVEEKWMDAITALSGSGPAYVFLFMEYLQSGARSLGLSQKLSDELVLQTIKGSLQLFKSQKESARILRKRVTSKGGTTQAALDVFSRRNTNKIFKDALGAAKSRAKKLSRS